MLMFSRNFYFTRQLRCALYVYVSKILEALKTQGLKFSVFIIIHFLNKENK